MYKEVKITEEGYRRQLAETMERLANLAPPQEMRADELLRAGKYLETLGPVWEAATPQERKEIYRLVLGVVYVDVLQKTLVEVVRKGAFASLFREGGVLLVAEKHRKPYGATPDLGVIMTVYPPTFLALSLGAIASPIVPPSPLSS